MKNKCGLLIGLALICNNAIAEDNNNGFHFSPYIGLDAQISFVEIGEENFLPLGARLRFGTYFWETIGVEITGGINAKDSEELGVRVGLKNSYTANIRWESPSTKGFSAYLLTGYGWHDLSVQNRENYPGTTRLRGANVGLGVKEKIGDWGLYVEYSRQFSKDDLQIDLLNIGTQYEF